MCYQRNECYLVGKFHLFSRLRNVIVPEIMVTRSLEKYDDWNFEEFC